jgi:hypothetical protein
MDLRFYRSDTVKRVQRADESSAHRSGGGYVCPRQVTEAITLELEQAMHVANVAEIVLPSRVLADSLLPGVDEFEDASHDGTRERRRALGKAADQFVEKLLGRYLEVKRISTALDEGVQKRKREHRNMRVPVVHQPHSYHRRLSRPTQPSFSAKSEKKVVATHVFAFLVLTYSATSSARA